MKRIPFLLLLLCLLPSCLIQVGGIHTSYSYLTDGQKKHVVPTSLPIDSLRFDGNIYVVGIEQVKDFIAAHDTAEVFFWNAGCGLTCMVPSMMEEVAAAHGSVPCILLDEFDWMRMPSVGTIRTPLLFIDVRRYGTDRQSKYLPAIKKDLSGLPDWDSAADSLMLEVGRSLLFRRGQFVPFAERERFVP